MAIFKLIVEKPNAELSFQNLQTATGLRTTTLVHHLREMERAWLLCRKRKGNEAFYSVTPQSLMTSMDRILEILNARYRPRVAA